MKTLKKIIGQYMQKITWGIVVVILIISFFAECLNAQRQERETADRMFHQMEQVLEENQRELAEIEEEYAQTCLKNAEGIAYIIQHHPTAMESVEELEKIAEFAEVDEIHIFDETGRIITGTRPDYYNMTFDSGEQIRFFKPMLEDKSLRLCQDITPNTAEGRLMQYSAVWTEDGKYIVQIGMEPVNVLQVTEKNELSYIFSLLKVNVGAAFYAIDMESGEIVGSTHAEDLGKHLTEVGFSFVTLEDKADSFHATVNGVDSYCVFTVMGGNYIGRVISNDMLYEGIPMDIFELAVCLIFIALILVRAMTGYMNRYVVAGIYDVNEKLRTITKGNLEENVNVQSSVEFTELSSHINDMIKSLLDNNKKMSYVLSKTNMYIGVYEHNEHMKNVRFTEYIPRVLSLSEEEVQRLSSDYKLFEAYIEKIRENSIPGEENIYQLQRDEERYVRIDESNENGEIFGVVIDVTEEIVKRKKIEEERDIDPLTGLYNRRGLDNKLSELFMHPEKLRVCAMIMIDADGLKEINDLYGHEKGDVYLKKISGILNNFGLKSSVAARQGGDEFVLFLYEYDDEEELRNTIKTLEYIQNHSSAYLDDNLRVPLKFSFGYMIANEDTDYSTLIKQADKKMYENKRERKNTTI